ncbi:transposase [Calothrix sp. FACHB-1219]|uniref:transposase n=1 Tax=unclassified Calothrix TaxID=2619626 RepID=UPI0016860E69|nr:transposase [Calothrix sp. FACHB-168]MBD2205933.1 transposase [Calothrix sp. FACHB-168]MBD2218185.1 transposase [Calothrix sp. FACHB-1219]
MGKTQLPAQLFIKLFEQVIERLAAKNKQMEVPPMWTSVASSFAAVWIADASTLEAVKKHLGQLQQKTGSVLGGKMLMVVEAFTHRPVAAFFDADAKRNETKWWSEITARLPIGGILITDMGFYGFEWFDTLTEQGKYVLTCLNLTPMARRPSHKSFDNALFLNCQSTTYT